MNAPLQKTKLFLPAARALLVERPRLLRQLDAVHAAGSRVVLVSAPAGSGKTTLVVQWLTRLAWPTAWVSLDSRDNLPARFFAYLIAALQTVAPGAGSQALGLLDLPGADLQEVVTLLTNDLADFHNPFILVLDDFHTITDPRLHRAVDFLLEAQPASMHLALLSREDPVLQLARWRARGQLVELRQEDLRFSLEEAVAFLNQSMNLHLSNVQAQALEDRTEGWIAGLQMAALSLQRSADVDRFIQEFSGSNRFILDYLMEEVLAHQPEHIQRFLLETSPLERLCAGLCAQVCGGTALNAQNLLEQLAKANLFVIPLDEERRWYRYHHLFADLLLSRMQTQAPQHTDALSLRASAWYEHNGEPRLAVEYALKAHAAQLAADLIERHIPAHWQTVDLEFFLLVNRLPQEVILRRPTLCLQTAWVQVITGHVERIVPLVEAAERCLADPERLPEPSDRANRAFARTLHAFLADLKNQPVELTAELGQAYAAIPAENPGMHNSVAVLLGMIYYMENDFSSAMAYFRDALELDKRVNGTNAVPISIARMSLVLQAQGRLRETLRLISEHVDYIRARGIRRFYISGALYLHWGEILLEWNQIVEAEALVREGLRLLEDWPVSPVISQGLSLLARVKVAQGDLPAAREALARSAILLSKGMVHPQFTAALDQARICLWIAEHNQAALAAWAEQNAPRAGQEIYFRYEARLIEVCRARIALGRGAQAAELLERLAQWTAGHSGSRVKILTLLAVAHSVDPGRATSILEEALRLAEPEGYLRTFLSAAEPLRLVLTTWLRHAPAGPLREYAQQILSAFDRPAQPRITTNLQPAGVAEPLTEPLSERELEVLQLVAQGLTNQQIAARLVISIRTVKKHVENIHGKLGVQNRTQAVARARELGQLVP